MIFFFFFLWGNPDQLRHLSRAEFDYPLTDFFFCCCSYFLALFFFLLSSCSRQLYEYNTHKKVVSLNLKYISCKNIKKTRDCIIRESYMTMDSWAVAYTFDIELYTKQLLSLATASRESGLWLVRGSWAQMSSPTCNNNSESLDRETSCTSTFAYYLFIFGWRDPGTCVS